MSTSTLPLVAPERKVVTSRGMFQDLSREIKRRKRENEPKRGTCFIEMRCIPAMRLYHQSQVEQIGVYKSNSGGHKAGDPKFRGVPNPFFDYVNRDEDNKPKSRIIHVTRTRASIYYNLQERIQNAQERAGNERTYKVGESAWEWRRFEADGDKMPFAYKVQRDPISGMEIEVPEKDRRIYLCVLPYHYKREHDSGSVMLVGGKPISLPFNESWYEDISTGTHIPFSEVVEWLSKSDDELEVARQGVSNKWEIERPLMPNITNITYLSVMGKKYSLRRKDFGNLTPVDFEALEWNVENDPVSVQDEELVPVKPIAEIKE